MDCLVRTIAHSKNDAGVRQTLEEHLANVAALAQQFASPFAQEKAAEYVAWAHDLGKMKASWQDRVLRLEAGEKPQWEELKHDHKMCGAALVYATSKLASLLIAGHHGGIPDFSTFVSEIESGKWEASRKEVAERVEALQSSKPPSAHFATDYFQLMMLFSCLVDADSIDTSAHFENRIATPRFNTMEELFDKLLFVQIESSASDAVQSMRSAVRDACLAKASVPRGFFSLHAPTGSGKTISGGLFATSHAVHHDLSRIIYVAPYRTIIDQTADIYGGIFGDENVLPHHSTADFWTGSGEAEKLQRQLAENWDVPIVVTTSEQFFESLFSGRPGAARKLHNLVNSVIVVDEPQALPLRLLTPCMAALKSLVSQFGCSVLFMSATVPALQHGRLLGGDTAVHDILDKDFVSAQRVSVDIDHFRSCYWSEVSQFMEGTKQSLSIANTKIGALRIFRGLPMSSRTYLSTWLCPTHRKEIVKSIKTKLSSGAACHVSSTQVIESGVDLDFPDTLLREKAPLDSLLQAFGRCNRNGNGEGRCYVFSPTEGNALKDYDKAISVVNVLLYERRLDPFAAETLSEYYKMLYAISNLDSKEIMKNVEGLNFETVRCGNEETEEGGFRLIANDQIHLIVEYGTAGQCKALQEAVSAIKAKVAADEVPPRWATRRLQNFVVSVFPNVFEKLDRAFPLAIEHLFLNYYTWKGDYSGQTGLGDVIDSLSSRDEE
jgi:CRISPR-associated endonuclease/helicase Cas3